MFERLDQALATIEAFVADFEPGLLDARGAVRAVERFSKGKHLCEAGLALAGKRADETFAHRESGARTAAEWMARKTGTTTADAERALETAALLGELPATNDAFRAGKISEAQAREIAGAAQRDPASECALVGQATQGISLKGLKDECRRVRAKAEADDEAWAQRLHDGRSLRTWIDADAAACGIWRMSPDKGAEVNAALDAEIDLIFTEARADGRRESREAYAADALHALITRGPRKATGAKLIIDGVVRDNGDGGSIIDIGDRCEIEGIGPVPRAIARQMLEHASVRAVPKAPELLASYSSPTRYIPPALRAWLEQAFPTCAQPGCDRDFGLQIDHVIGLADGGLTEITNLWRLCWHHHDLKTTKGWKVEGEFGAWRLVPPVPARAGPDPP